MISVVKICKTHGELTQENTYKRPDNGSLRCNFCQNVRTKKYQKKERSILLERIQELEKLVHESLKEIDGEDATKIYDSLFDKLKKEIETNHISGLGNYVLNGHGD